VVLTLAIVNQMAEATHSSSDILGDPNGGDTSIEKIILYPFTVVVGIFADLINLELLSVSLVELVVNKGSIWVQCCEATTIDQQRTIIKAMQHIPDH
jgi:hypothetical protein